MTQARLQLDDDGCVVDWDLCMTALTGFTKEEVVGLSYASLIAPLRLSDAYRAAVLEWVGARRGPSIDGPFLHGWKIPLPLPLRDGGGRWIELLAWWTAPTKSGSWLAGREFSLRAALLPATVAAAPEGTAFDRVPDDAFEVALGALSYRERVVLAATCAGLRERLKPRPIATDVERRCLLEVVDVVRRALDLPGKQSQKSEFSANWSAALPALHARVVAALGGVKYIKMSAGKQGVDKWTVSLPDASGRSAFSGLLLELTARLLRSDAGVGSRPASAAVMPDVFEAPPDLTCLQVHIEYFLSPKKRAWGDDAWAPAADWCRVVVPATLNMHQFHRVVVQAMTCGDSPGGSCRTWSSTMGQFSVQVDDPTADWHETCLKEGLRQRLSLGGGAIALHVNGWLHCDPFRACEHRTCLGAVLYRRGARLTLMDGTYDKSPDYRITLEDAYAVEPRPGLLDGRNVGLARCLKGKASRGVQPRWSEEAANAQLRTDKAYLRKSLWRDDATGSSLALPWCATRDSVFSSKPTPLPLRLVAPDFRPVALAGEPPLPASPDAPECAPGGAFQRYISGDPERVKTKYCWDRGGKWCYNSGDGGEETDDVDSDDDALAFLVRKRKRVSAPLAPPAPPAPAPLTPARTATSAAIDASAEPPQVPPRTAWKPPPPPRQSYYDRPSGKRRKGPALPLPLCLASRRS
jgi:hypothetical protein